MVKMRDIAEACGTSQSTVSRALNGFPTVDPDIAASIRTMAEQLGYKPNQAGRDLRMGMDANYGPDFTARSRKNLQIKNQLAAYAAQLVTDRDTVILDSGSTIAQMIPYLPHGVIVTTNSLSLLQPAAKRGITVHLAPGMYVPAMAAVFGADTERYFATKRADKYFFSTARVDVVTGLYNMNPTTVGVKRKLIQNSGTSILLVDHEKFSDAGLPSYAPLSSVDVLITDFIPEALRDRVVQSGIKFIELTPTEPRQR